jgi:hypothetical protein
MTTVNQRKVLIWVAGVVLIALLFPALFRIVFAAKDEVSYSAGLSITTCQGFLANGYSSPESCRANYRVVLGNTGSNPQQEVLLTLAPVPDTWLLSSGALDIVASAERRAVPGIEHQQLEERLRITVTNLEPNRLVEINVTTRGAEAAELLSTAAITIDANGTVIESNPRLTVTARFFRNLFSVVGF